MELLDLPWQDIIESLTPLPTITGSSDAKQGRQLGEAVKEPFDGTKGVHTAACIRRIGKVF